MSSRVLVCLDGSRRAEGALPYAMACAGSEGVIILAEVPEPVYYHPRYGPQGFGELSDIIGTRIAGYLQNLVKELEARGYRARFVTPHGAVPEALLSASESEEAGLIILTSHGRTGPGRWMLGSVAERIVRHATAPVLLLPAAVVSDAAWQEARLPILRSVLLPLDGSSFSERIFQFPDLVPIRPEQVHLVTACDLLPGFLEPQEQAELMKECDSYLKLVASGPEMQPYEVSYRTRAASPAEAILAAAEDVHPDLIAMMTQGNSGLTRFLMGSVAEKVARAAVQPVLLLNAHCTSADLPGQEHSQPASA